MDLRIGRALLLVVVLAAGLAIVGCQTQQPSGVGEGEGAPEAVAVTEVGTTTEVTQTGQSVVPLDTYVGVTIGEPESMDPAWTYETTGAAYEGNIYEGLVYFNREKADEFVPALATEWNISDDKLTYDFTIREGITFHEGGTLEPHDIAYSLQRAMLQDRVDGPMALFLKPIMGVDSIEQHAVETAGLTEGIDRRLENGQVVHEDATLDDVPPEVTQAICEEMKTAVSFDDEAMTVTIKVKAPTPWFLQLLSQPWGAAMDMEWMVEQGDWDGDCATWPQWHDPEAQESVLFEQANGTGPYKFVNWKKGEEITLIANDAYWRTEPIWEGGPSGPPAITHIVLQKVDEWGTRFAKLEAGEADTIDVPRANISQVEPMVHTVYEGRDENAPAEVVNENGTLKLFKGYPTVQNTAAMFSFEINPESEFIGSGQLDGDGIPADFFSDIHVRKAFNYCFDWETYIADGLQGEGVQTRGPIIEGLQGYTPDSPVYSFDLEKCKAELALAWDGQVAEKGFKMTLVYNEGNETRKMAAQILAEKLALADAKYVVTVQDLEWPNFLEARRAEKLPISISGWLEDYHDASNWVHPYMHSTGAYGRAQHFPEELQTQFDELIDAAVIETDEATRVEMYTQLQQLAYDHAIDIFLEQATGRAYHNRQVVGWFDNPLAPGTWYYALFKQP